MEAGRLFIVQGNFGYGHGWEDLTASRERPEAVDDLHAYRDNDPDNRYRLVSQRER